MWWASSLSTFAHVKKSEKLRSKSVRRTSLRNNSVPPQLYSCTLTITVTTSSLPHRVCEERAETKFDRHCASEEHRDGTLILCEVFGDCVAGAGVFCGGTSWSVRVLSLMSVKMKVMRPELVLLLVQSDEEAQCWILSWGVHALYLVFLGVDNLHVGRSVGVVV